MAFVWALRKKMSTRRQPHTWTQRTTCSIYLIYYIYAILHTYRHCRRHRCRLEPLGLFAMKYAWRRILYARRRAPTRRKSALYTSRQQQPLIYEYICSTLNSCSIFCRKCALDAFAAYANRTGCVHTRIHVHAKHAQQTDKYSGESADASQIEWIAERLAWE